MPIAEIAAAQASIKALYGMVSGLAGAAVDHEFKTRLIAIQAAILDTQAKLGDAQSERIALLEELSDTKQRLREATEQAAALAEYDLVSLEPGKVVYKSKINSAVEDYACPACYANKKIGHLQQSAYANRQTGWHCSSCSFNLTTGGTGDSGYDASARRRSYQPL